MYVWPTVAYISHVSFIFYNWRISHVSSHNWQILHDSSHNWWLSHDISHNWWISQVRSHNWQNSHVSSHNWRISPVSSHNWRISHVSSHNCRILQVSIVITLYAQWFLLRIRVERSITDLTNIVCRVTVHLKVWLGSRKLMMMCKTWLLPTLEFKVFRHFLKFPYP